MKPDKYHKQAARLMAELKTEATRKGLSTYQLADLTGFAQPNVHRMLSGRVVPRLDNYLKLKDVITRSNAS